MHAVEAEPEQQHAAHHGSSPKAKIVAQPPAGRKRTQLPAVEELDEGGPAAEILLAVEAVLASDSMVSTFSEIGNWVCRPRPPIGSNHKMWIWIGETRFRAVKDTDASLTTIPEHWSS